MDECNEVTAVQKNLRKKGPSSSFFDGVQEQAAQIGQKKVVIASIAKDRMEHDEFMSQGPQETQEKSKLTTSSNVSDNASASIAVSFPKLGKKAESLSMKELKSELGKRGQPIDGNKKGNLYVSYMSPTFVVSHFT